MTATCWLEPQNESLFNGKGVFPAVHHTRSTNEIRFVSYCKSRRIVSNVEKLQEMTFSLRLDL